MLTNVRSVQVDGGATLEFAGAATFTNLVVDVSRGVGTIKGGGFGANGTVQVQNCVAGAGAQALECDLSETTGPENIAGWGVTVDGVERSRWHVRYADGRLTVFPPGMRMYFR